MGKYRKGTNKDRKTYGLNDIYILYKKEHEASINNYKELYKSYDDVVKSIERQINDINIKLNVFKKFDIEQDNIDYIKQQQGSNYNDSDSYISLLRGNYKRLYDNKIERSNINDNLVRLSNSYLSEREFKYIYKSYNFHFSNAILEGYRNFFIGGGLGKIVIDTFKNKGRKRGIDWGNSKKLKKQLLADGKELYKEWKDEDGTVHNNGGAKWLLTFNYKEFDAFWKWKAMKVNITKIHKFVPTNYRPTIIFNKDGKQLTTSELETLSTIEDIKGFKIGNVQKTTIITNLDERYYQKYNDEFELKDYKIKYKTNI